MEADKFTSDMANIDVQWEVEGIITPEESVTKMLVVFAEKGKDDSGTFWCWDGRVSTRTVVLGQSPTNDIC
jgi:hypothetical protein